jgi:hypothetical protein
MNDCARSLTVGKNGWPLLSPPAPETTQIEDDQFRRTRIFWVTLDDFGAFSQGESEPADYAARNDIMAYCRAADEYRSQARRRWRRRFVSSTVRKNITASTRTEFLDDSPSFSRAEYHQEMQRISSGSGRCAESNGFERLNAATIRREKGR